jgi:transcriptional regulator with XRE-family HTH domain
MRDREDWSQQELATRAGMTQNAISRLENPFYGKATISTLKRIAAVFDVALVVRFEPFSYLVKWVTGTTFEQHGLTMESTRIPSFGQENLSASRGVPEVPAAAVDSLSAQGYLGCPDPWRGGADSNGHEQQGNRNGLARLAQRG